MAMQSLQEQQDIDQFNRVAVEVAMTQQKSLRIRTLGILIETAHNRSVIHYADLATRLGLPNSGNALGACLTPILEDLYQWADKNDLPEITSLVVRKSGTGKGIPGQGFWELWADGVGKDWTHESRRKALASIHMLVYAYYDIPLSRW